MASLIALCLACSVFFSLSEAALLSLRPAALSGWKNERIRHRITFLLSNPRSFYILVFFFNLVSNSIASMLVLRSFLEAGASVPLAAVQTVLVMSVVITVFGEIFPKTFASKYARQVVSVVVTPLTVLYLGLRPIFEGADRLTSFLLASVETRVGHDAEAVTEEELRSFLTTGQREGGLIGQTEEAMIHGVFEFTDRVVRQVMCPRPDIVSVDVNESPEGIFEIVEEADCSRLPVYEGGTDSIVGILHTKNLLAAMANASEGETVELRSLLREPYFVPEIMPVSDLLKEFRVRKIHMALVVDEFGGIAGLVTLEDLLEEIVGEIVDEGEEEERLVTKIAEGEWSIDARSEIDEVGRTLGIDFGDEECETLGGFVFDRVGHFPEVGVDTVRYRGHSFEVCEAQQHRILRVRVRKEPE